MPNRILPGVLCGVLSLALIPGAATAVTCSGSRLTYLETGNDPATFPLCGSWGRCQTPAGTVLGYTFDSPGCDPNATPCAMTATVSVTFPGNHQNDPGLTGGLYSYAEVDFLDSKGSFIAVCGLSGSVIAQDRGTATARANVSCADPEVARYTLKLISCPTCPPCPTGGPPASCIKTTTIALDFAGPTAANCAVPPEPPPDHCENCTSCSLNGGGSGCSTPVTGKGPACALPNSGPGAHLRYLAGGAGGAGLPGTAAWRTALGLYWSHEYAQRIVPAGNRAFLITEGASFRELSNLAPGSGLRLYQAHAPSDEYRKLYFDTATGGWVLDSLNGRKDFFRNDGLWIRTALSQNPAHPTEGFYNGANQLISVSFSDGRSEIFTYHPGGKLASITEIPVPGSGTPPRTWNYLWSGDELIRIERPDSTAWELTYDPARNGGRPGYLTQVRLIGTDGVSGRIEVAYEYDSFGSVSRSWNGAANFSDPGAVNRQEYTYTNPQFPTRTDVREWINSAQSQVTTWEFDRDPVSTKARVNKISGDCPVCGTGPNSQFTYGDTANPLLPTQILDGRGLITQFGYNVIGKMTSKSEAVGTLTARTTLWRYENAAFPDLPTRIETPSTSGGSAQRVTVLSYDASGNLTTQTVQGAESGGSFSFTTLSTHNASGQPLFTDPPGYGAADRTSYTYDAARGDLIPLTRTDPLIGATAFDHDGFNRQASVTNPNAVKTATAYDGLNRVTSVIQGADSPEALTTTHQYNLFGDLFRTLLPRGNLIEYGYDAAGRLVSIERKPDAATKKERTFYTLNTFGHRIKEELQRWDGTAWITESFTDYVYSSRCHLDKTVHADGTATEYAYDCNGNLEKVWDANHPRATNPIPTQLYQYDSLNRLTSVTQPWTGPGGATAVTSYAYDVQDHLTSVTDAEGNTTTYTHSDRDLMTQEVSPVSGTTIHAYNEHGEMVSETDARGITMTREVDELDRVTLLDYPDNSLDTTYIYDDPAVLFSKGRLTKIARTGSEIAYEYDRFGRITQDGSLGYQYDDNGNRTHVEYPGGVTAIYSHDYADREATLSYDAGSGAQPLVTASAYKPFGPLTSLSLGNGLTEIRRFDSRYFPDRIQAGNLLDWNYTEDAVGNPTQITGTIVGQPYTANFVYQDNLYFLTQGNGPWGARSWTYDRIGNRLTHQETGQPTLTYTYGGSGHNSKLTQITPAPGLGTGSLQFSYDPAGNQTSLQEILGGGPVDTTFLDMSQDNRLTSLRPVKAPGRTDMLYDGRGFLRQAHLTYTDSKEFVRVASFYSSEGVLMARTDERAWAGSVPGPEETVASIWLFGSNETTQVFYFAGRPVAQKGMGPELYLAADHLGTPVLVTDTNGKAVWAGGLEPFGRIWMADDPDPALSPDEVFLRYPGQWASDAFQRVGGVPINLYYNVHRWYAPAIGRYTRPDPLGVESGKD